MVFVVFWFNRLRFPRLKTIADMTAVKLPLAKLRKLALAQQGLLKNNHFGTGMPAVERAINHIGYAQIDTISVVERAHHHVLWSRVKDYQPDYLAQLVANKKIFEYWFHAAAFLPINDFRFALPRMHAIKAGEKHWFDNIDKKLLRNVYKRIESEGPLRARDFDDRKKTSTGWWDWKPAKQALEKLFMQGDLMVVGREGFQKRYDLTENVLPENTDTRFPDNQEQALHLIRTNLRAHGFASLKSFTYLRRGKPLRTAVKEQVDFLVDQKKLLLIQTPDGEQFYIEPEMLEQKPRAPTLAKLLSPFDNLVIQRKRCSDIFEFDYQIECYVPQAKRQYGYFCLPILFKDRLIGRADLKADRKDNVLRINNFHLETDENVLESVAIAVRDFMTFNNCEAVSVEQAASASLKKKLKAVLR